MLNATTPSAGFWPEKAKGKGSGATLTRKSGWNVLRSRCEKDGACLPRKGYSRVLELFSSKILLFCLHNGSGSGSGSVSGNGSGSVSGSVSGSGNGNGRRRQPINVLSHHRHLVV